VQTRQAIQSEDLIGVVCVGKPATATQPNHEQDAVQVIGGFYVLEDLVLQVGAVFAVVLGVFQINESRLAHGQVQYVNDRKLNFIPPSRDARRNRQRAHQPAQPLHALARRGREPERPGTNSATAGCLRALA